MIFFSDVLYTSDPPLYSVGHNKSLFPTECECVRCHGRKSDRMTDFGCHDKLYIHIRLQHSDIQFPTGCEGVNCHGRKLRSDDTEKKNFT